LLEFYLRATAREKLEIVLFASAFGRGGRKGGSGFALPPAEPVNEIGSDIFKYPPHYPRATTIPITSLAPDFFKTRAASVMVAPVV